MIRPVFYNHVDAERLDELIQGMLSLKLRVGKKGVNYSNVK